MCTIDSKSITKMSLSVTLRWVLHTHTIHGTEGHDNDTVNKQGNEIRWALPMLASGHTVG